MKKRSKKTKKKIRVKLSGCVLLLTALYFILWYKGDKLIIKNGCVPLTQVDIFTLRGQKIVSKRIQNHKRGKAFIIPVDFLSNGAYIVKTFSGKETRKHFIFTRHR